MSLALSFRPARTTAGLLLGAAFGFLAGCGAADTPPAPIDPSGQPSDQPADPTDPGDSDGSGVIIPELPPTPPVAKAGEHQSVYEGAAVCLDGSASTDLNNDVLSFTWEQTAGEPVDIAQDPSNPARICFTAPYINEKSRLVFRLTVDDGALSADTSIAVDVQSLPQNAFLTLSTQVLNDWEGIEEGYLENFESYGLNADPTGWVDTAAENSMAVNNGLFRATRLAGQNIFTTASTATNIHSHYVSTSSTTWSSYAFTGRMMLDDAFGGVGVTFFSGYNQSDRYYRLRRGQFSDEARSFRIAPHGTTISGGTVDTGVIPQPGVWYRFRIEVEDAAQQTNIRARVWQDGYPEPSLWQVDCYDRASSRLRQGTIGVWSMAGGNKYWDDFQVKPLNGGSRDPLHWVDTGPNFGLTVDDSLFGDLSVNGVNAFATVSDLPNIHSHYVGPGSENWTNYIFGGRMYVSQASAGIGVTFFSSYPNQVRYYRLRRSGTGNDAAFHIAPMGTFTTGGALSTGVVPEANKWYEFKVRVESTDLRTTIKAKVWPVGGSEPANWQADCYDTSPSRHRRGTIGVWSMGTGQKYWRDLYVADIGTDPCALDTDGDRVNDCADGCPDDPAKTHPGSCGCGTSDTDTDGDGFADCIDECPDDPNKTDAGDCGCGTPDLDSDRDGTADCLEPPPPGDYEEDFAAVPCDGEPADWLDTGANFSVAEDAGLFRVNCAGAERFFGTRSVADDIHTHYIGLDSAAWSAYRLTGRLVFTDAASGVGITFLSEFPTGDRYYRIRRYRDNATLHLASRVSPGTTPIGAVSTGVSTRANVWYRFVLEVENGVDRTDIRAKFWEDGAAEPTVWQINAFARGNARLQAGTFGFWTSGPGGKFVDDLRISEVGLGDGGGGGDDGGSDPCADDSDGDGVSDCSDACPSDPRKSQPGVCGCGVADTDANGNGVIDCQEPTTPPPSTGAMSTASRTSGVAPLAVFFDVIGAQTGVQQPTDGDFPSVRYAWNFGDPLSGAWSTDGTSRNLAVGHVAAHVFDLPGTYTVTLQVKMPNGDTKAYAQVITVQPFSGTTYYVAANGNDLNNGLTPDMPFRTFDKAMKLARDNTRIRFRRGDTFTTSYGASLSGSGPGLIDSYGSGALPKIAVANNFSAAFKIFARDWRLVDLHIYGPPGGQGCGIDGGVSQGQQLLMNRLKVEGFDMGFVNSYMKPPITHDQNFLVNSEMFGQSNKAVYIGGSRTAVLGCRLHDTGSHILRMWHAIKAVVAHNELLDPKVAEAAVIKLHNDSREGQLPDGRWIIIADNLIRGHTWDVTVGTQGGWANETVRDVVIERNFVEVIGPTQICFRISAQNVLARNNIGDLTGSNYACKLFAVVRWGAEPSPVGARLFNNAVYRRDAGEALLTEALLGDSLMYNNVAWSSSGKVRLGVTNSNSLNNLTSNPLWANTASGDLRVGAGSPVIDAGRQAAVYDDYLGAARPVDGDGRNGAVLDVGPVEFIP